MRKHQISSPGWYSRVAGCLLACLNPRIANHIWVNLRGGTDSLVKFSGRKISKIGIYPKITIKKIWHFFQNIRRLM
jgi:hypothetical protein